MPDFIPLTWLTPQQNANIGLLADTLGNLTRLRELAGAHGYAAFSMAMYEGESEEHCGTVACAIGYAPIALGLPRQIGQGWETYAAQHLGLRWPDWPDEDDQAQQARDAYQWLFGGGWFSSDNTPEGAAYRLNLALTHGIPVDATARYFKSTAAEAYAGLPNAEFAIANAKPAAMGNMEIALTEG